MHFSTNSLCNLFFASILLVSSPLTVSASSRKQDSPKTCTEGEIQQCIDERDALLLRAVNSAMLDKGSLRFLEQFYNQNAAIIPNKCRHREDAKIFEVDLHNLCVREALAVVKHILSEKPLCQFLHLITGKGLHSRRGIPLIKRALRKKYTNLIVDSKNQGVLIVSTVAMSGYAPLKAGEPIPLRWNLKESEDQSATVEKTPDRKIYSPKHKLASFIPQNLLKLIPEKPKSLDASFIGKNIQVIDETVKIFRSMNVNASPELEQLFRKLLLLLR